MSASRNEVEGLRHAAELREIERLYHSVAAAVGGVLTHRYGLNDAEATSLIEEAFYAYLQVSAPASEPESWLVSIICSRAEALHRNRACEGEDVAHDTKLAHRILSSQRLLSLLPPNAQEALQLRFGGQRTYEEIAAELQVTVRYAQHLIDTSLEKLRERVGK